MPRTFDLLKAQLIAMGISDGAGGGAMRVEDQAMMCAGELAGAF